jgi:hypothetical protein
MVKHGGKSSTETNEYLQENEVFDGSSNAMLFSRTYKMALHCSFQHQKYPFDTQRCSIKVSNSFYEIEILILVIQ